ncbi:copper resistance CopC family protein [Pelagibius marinus]|uniref:copper resistance CopC family protein n=1 Tax=Pelagibius marinus TaxID=2762760 RepID=UPI001872EEA8|nr:copper resistance CopC family protein [Pelagibius marinus]
MLSNLLWKKLAIRFAAVAALAAAFCLPGESGLAHSKGPKIMPANGSELSEAPESLNFVFAQPVRLTAVRLYDGADSEVDLPGKRSIEAAKERRIELPSLEAGAYRVEWRALSADGHPVDGAFSFAIVPAQ